MSLPHFQDVPFQCNNQLARHHIFVKALFWCRYRGYKATAISGTAKAARYNVPSHSTVFPRARPHNENLSEIQDNKGNN